MLFKQNRVCILNYIRYDVYNQRYSICTFLKKNYELRINGMNNKKERNNLK